MTTSPFPTRIRLYSHVTKTRFLHVEDSLRIGKLRLFAGTYRRGGGMVSHSIHFLDLADARVICHALLHGESPFTYKEYKGTPPRNGEPAVSRVLSVAVKGDKVYVELTRGPGKVTPTGAITPNGRPETAVNAGFDAHQARRMAATVLAYLRAWDVHRMMVHQDLVGSPPPFSLVSAGRGNGRSPGAAMASKAQMPAADHGGNGRLAARKGKAMTSEETAVSAAAADKGQSDPDGEDASATGQDTAGGTAIGDRREMNHYQLALATTQPNQFDYHVYKLLEKNELLQGVATITNTREMLVPQWKPDRKTNRNMMLALRTYLERRLAKQADGYSVRDAHVHAKGRAMWTFQHGKEPR